MKMLTSYSSYLYHCTICYYCLLFFIYLFIFFIEIATETPTFILFHLGNFVLAQERELLVFCNKQQHAASMVNIMQHQVKSQHTRQTSRSNTTQHNATHHVSLARGNTHETHYYSNQMQKLKINTAKLQK